MGGSALLAGCARIGWWGAPEEPPLPGERIPIMLLDEALRADPALAGLPVVAPPPVANPAWTQAAGNAAHAMHHLALAGTLRPAWRADAGQGSRPTARLLASPVVAEGRVFTVDTGIELRAFALDSGRLLWAVRPELEERLDRLSAGGLAVEEGRLFVTTTAGEVHALDAADGRPLWRRALRVPIEAPPAVAEGRLLVLSSDNRTWALDAATGQPLWQHAGFVGGPGLLGGAPPAIAAGLVIAPYSSGDVFALDLADGRPLWSGSVLRLRRTLALGDIVDITAAPVVDRDRVYVAGNGGEVAAFALARGQRRWSLPVPAGETPWLAGDFLFLLTSRNELACLRAADGRVRWVRSLPRLLDPEDSGSPRILWSAPVLAGGRLLLAGTTGRLLEIRIEDGEPIRERDLGQAVRLQPVVAAQTLLLLTEAGQLLAFR